MTTDLSLRACALVAALLAAPLSAIAAPHGSVDHASGCRIDIAPVGDDEAVHWSGACVDGLADGDGALTSAHGTVVVGTFRQGSPVAASGRVAVPLNSGPTLGTYGVGPGGMPMIGPMPALPGGALSPVDAATISGTWTRFPTDPSSTCRGTERIENDGRRTVRFGEAVEEDGISVAGDARDPSKVRILSTVLSRQGSDACMPDGAVGETRVFFARIQDAGHALACNDAAATQCYARWERAPSPGATAAASASAR